MLLTPLGNHRYQGGTWAADSGCFSPATYVGDEQYGAWLERQARHADDCLFATAPDVVGDHEATLVRSTEWLPRIRSFGYRAAFVLQDGATIGTVPWDALDWVFIGGSTEWKLGPDARAIAAHAKAIGKGVHMGRVNSEKRLRYASHIGCDTADGTYLAFGPDVNLPKLLAWIRGVNDQMEMT